ncbi:MAG: dihydroorotate dehydrogenase-like protein [Acidimicrobiia bacterium]|nr:dihydroorotate dehydrogenase-like protein [Acidimicrobiia bacterium]
MSVDLTTRYLGLDLVHPIVPSASPMTGNLASLQELEEAGASAVVLWSLFEEQIEHDEQQALALAELHAESFGEAVGGYFPTLEDYNTGPGEYLKLIRNAKEHLNIPVIASLNGTSIGGWLRYGRLMEEAGADALELNIYMIPTDPRTTGADVEQQYLNLVTTLKGSISIPLAVKVGPFFSSIPNMATRLVEAGADGLVLFNRFYQPDIDLDELAVQPNLRLSTSDELRLPLRWTAILKGQVLGSLAVTSGVHTAEDVIKLLLAGADVTMMASALLKHGPERLTEALDGLRLWLEANEYESVRQMKGSMSQASSPDPEAFERGNYMKTLVTFARPMR